MESSSTQAKWPLQPHATTQPPTDKQIQFAKLGSIDPSLFNNERNEGLTKFIEANVLHKKMTQQGHIFSANADGDILIKYNGVDTPWSEVKKLLDDGVIKHDGAYKLVETYYTYQGLVTAPDISKLDIDSATLDELLQNAVVVFRYDDPKKWNNQHVMSIITHSHSSGPEQEKEHAWIHFKDPDGRILSLGLYRTKPGLATQPGRIERVDNYESYKDTTGVRDECDIRVTPQQWEAKLRDTLKMAQEPVVYHQLKNTCATFITKAFSDLTDYKEFDSGVHVTQLHKGSCTKVLQLLPESILDQVGSYFISKAGTSMSIESLKEHEIKQAKIDQMTPDQKNKLKENMDAASVAFANLSPADQSMMDHPYAIRQKGLQIAAYRLEMIQGLQELFRKQIIEDEKHIDDPQLRSELKLNYQENFKQSVNDIMLDLPPVGWKPPAEIPKKHPDYHEITIESDISDIYQ